MGLGLGLGSRMQSRVYSTYLLLSFSLLAELSHVVEDAHLAGDDLQGPWWTKEHPREERDSRAKILRSNEVLRCPDAIQGFVAPLTITGWDWRGRGREGGREGERERET